jgi:hypothetical protein
MLGPERKSEVGFRYDTEKKNDDMMMCPKTEVSLNKVLGLSVPWTFCPLRLLNDASPGRCLPDRI